MRDGSKILYIIGHVLYILRTLLWVLYLILVLSAKALIASGINGSYPPGFPENPEPYLALLTVLFVICVIVSIAKVIVGFLGSKALSNQSDKVGIHIANIVFGICTGSIFYLIAGILAICGKNEVKRDNQ
jgi:hypothetical protein